MDSQKKSNLLPIVVICLLVAVVGVYMIISRVSSKDTPSPDSSLNISDYDLSKVIPPSEANGNIGDHIKGDENAPVTIIEYADYQCSGCANLNSVMKELLKEYDGKLRIIYRNFPLTSIHPNAIAAASAVEAAGLQGYWESYGDLLFSNQAEWFYDSGTARTDRFMGYFTSLAGDTGSLTKFRQDMSSSSVKKKVEFDKAIAEYLAIDATPSFYGSDGEMIDWISAELNTKEDVLNFFRNYIDTELSKLASTSN